MSPVSGITSLTREVSRIETAFSRARFEEFAVVEGVIPLARASGDLALLGRTLCLLARAQIMQGQHEGAIVSAAAGSRAFDALEPSAARKACGPRSETLRTAGNALMKLGRIAEALPLLEEAVLVAEAGGEPALRGDDATPITTVSALVRSLNTLGAALSAVRETDAAIDVFHRTLAVADAHTESYESCPDDILLALWNLIEGLHERSRRRCAAGSVELANNDLTAAQSLLDSEARRMFDSADVGDDDGSMRSLKRLSANGREGYYGCLGHQLLLTARPVEALRIFQHQLDEMERRRGVEMYEYVSGIAQAGMAQAALALGSPEEALRHCGLAVAAFDRHDEVNERATVLLVRSAALRTLGRHQAAFAALEEHHALRSRLEAEAAQLHARHMSAKLGLERARADAQLHRRMAATLETLGRIGQEITANLHADKVFAVLHRHVGTLLDASAFTVWLLDALANTCRWCSGWKMADRLPGPISRSIIPSRPRRERYANVVRFWVSLRPRPALQ